MKIELSETDETVEEVGSVDPSDRVYLFYHRDLNDCCDRIYWEWQTDLSEQENLETIERYVKLFMGNTGCLYKDGVDGRAV